MLKLVNTVDDTVQLLKVSEKKTEEDESLEINLVTKILQHILDIQINRERETKENDQATKL